VITLMRLWENERRRQAHDTQTRTRRRK
jgi:hypothetical protein